ncbi:virulence-associated protein E [Selenomonas sp. FOBRC9]|uniref:virulence-associated E family protein n=1 Tax=Selenomonas sp. FOBRC9 TaxID=936573 RepID=UPI00027A4823|nr:virulence-associated E family protein [Selenomonas sp. FOBRC9]EJP32008.1 virulence-associated protein E [Selenomonas sp. FOBRC9]
MRELAFCLGNSRAALVWHPGKMTMDALWEKLQNPIRTAETAAEYRSMKKCERDVVKDKGGFFAGTLKGTRRRATEVISRSMITLDHDRLEQGCFDDFAFKHCTIVYTTHSHIPEAPRARILVPLTRDVTPDEYNAIARYLADEIGMDTVDLCSFKINQLMYWPTSSSDGEYICRRYEGNWLDPDAFLAAHPNWQDCSSLPTAPGETEAVERERKRQADPLTKEGIVGAFCRAYPLQEAMQAFLSDVYEPTADENRWGYTKSASIPGVMIYDGKFAYSHHASDPAYGKLCNVYDLVGMHLFDGDFTQMAEFAAKDEKVRTLALKERQERAVEDFAEEDDWKDKLVRQKKSTQIENSLYNIKLIMQNDPYMKNIVFNQLADGMEIKGEVPWSHPGKFWRDADDAQLICYVDDNYGTFSARNYDIAVAKAVDDRSYHPIREYFAALPPWDGVARVDTLLIDYLGAADNAYTRAVSRKVLCAAYRRIKEPGIKFDYMPVLNGAQGIGKSTFIANLGMDWFSDSLTLSDMNDKTAAEKLQGYWILEIGELAGMKKADLDKVKAFVSRVDDKYRASFGRRVTSHPRQCVFFGTTNSENGYLRDITGNRRYWNIKLSGSSKYRPWQMTSELVQQIWAEVMILADAGEKLYLPPDLEEYAKEEQREAMEHDEREGLVRLYLDTLLPANWDEMDLYQRREFLRGDDTTPVGTDVRVIVSNMEIWCECFSRKKEDLRSMDSYAIAAIMSRLPEWEKQPTPQRIAIYGLQRIYRRL